MFPLGQQKVVANPTKLKNFHKSHKKAHKADKLRVCNINILQQTGYKQLPLVIRVQKTK
jgi:hypothetical protein